jgi:putative membrane protein
MNWQEPQRQSAIGIFLFAGKAFREMIAVVLIVFGSLIRKQKSTSAYLLTLGLLALFIFGRALLEYLYFRFYILEGQLVVKKGLFSKKHIAIPFERIQTVQLEQNLFHRIIHHYRVSIDTAGTEKSEVTIHALSYNKALSLKAALTEHVIVNTTEPSAVESQDHTIKLSFKDLMKLAISHNHLETIGLIIAFILARFNDIKEMFGIDAYDYLEEHGKQVAVTTQIIAISAFFAIAFAILISILRIVLKFSDLQITLSDKGFNLKHGLLHSKQQFIGSNKIQYIQWSANWIRRKIGMYMFHVKTTGEDELKNKQKIQLPVTRAEFLGTLSAYYQPSMPSASSEYNTIQKVYAIRKTLLVGIPVTIVLTTALFFAVEWWSLLFLLWLVYFHCSNIIYRKNFCFWVNDEGLEIASGVWGRKRLVLNWHKMQVVSISQGIYQRSHRLADLIIHTASGDVVLPYITLDEAQMLSDYAAYKAESSQKRWM